MRKQKPAVRRRWPHGGRRRHVETVGDGNDSDSGRLSRTSAFSTFQKFNGNKAPRKIFMGAGSEHASEQASQTQQHQGADIAVSDTNQGPKHRSSDHKEG